MSLIRSYKVGLDIIYSRVSTDDQSRDDKVSLDEQIECCQEYLARMSLTNFKVYREDHSGFEFDRPELDKIKALIEAKQVRSLTFLRVDRLTRKPAHLDQLRDRFLMPYQVQVHSPHDLGQWNWTPASIHMQDHFASFSQYWGKILVEVMTAGRIGKIKKGSTYACGQPPFGYQEIEVEKGKNCFVVDELEGQIVRSIFKWYTDEGLSLNQIRKRLVERKVPTYTELRQWTPFKTYHEKKTNGSKAKWQGSTIQKILTNETYLGTWAYGKTKIVRSPKGVEIVKTEPEEQLKVSVPAIVSQERFEKVQRLLVQNRQTRIGPTTNRYLLSRRLTCDCGYKMLSTTKGKNRYLYYICPVHGKNSSWHRECNSKKSIQTKILDNAIWDWIESLMTNRDVFLHYVREFYEESQEKIKPLKQKLQYLEAKKDQIKRKLDKLLDLYLSSDSFTKEALVAKKKSLEDELKSNEFELLEVREQISLMTQDKYDPVNWSWEDAVYYHELLFESFLERQKTFPEKINWIEKLDVRARLEKLDNDRYLMHVECKFKSDTLGLLNLNIMGNYNEENIQFYWVFTDSLLIDFASL